MATTPILCLLVVIGMLSPSSMANLYRNSLMSDESLKANEVLNSGDYSFIMQANCNLVLYRDSTALWSTGTGGKDYSCYAKLLRGGKLVVYSPQNVSLWESTSGRTGSEYVLLLRKDGNVVIYGYVKWSVAWPNEVSDQRLVTPEPTNILYSSERLTTGESLILGSFNCTMKTDCNFQCRNGTKSVWSTATAGKGSECSLELDYNGKVTIYDRVNAIVWSSTSSRWDDGNYVFLIQKRRLLGIYGPKLWSTKLNSLTSNSTTQISNRKIAMVMSQ